MFKKEKKENKTKDPFYKREIINFNLARSMLIIWILIFIVSATAFAGFTTKLTSEAEATIQKHIYDYVYIEHVSISGSSNGSNMYYSFEDHEIKPTTNISTCDGYVEYALDIVNTTPYKAFITTTQVKSMINGSGSSTNSMTVEFTDVEANSTYIEPHSTKTIHVRVKNNCSGSDSQVTSTINFEYSLYKYFDLTVVADQSDATVKLTTTEGTFTGTGTVTHRVAEGETAAYIASKHHYYDAAGNYKMETLDHTVNVTLAPDPRRDLTINISTNTHFNSTVTLKDSKGTVITPESGTKYIVDKGETYTYTVQNDEYYDATGSYTVNDNDGQIINVTLQERPWITGTVSNTNRTTAATKTDTNYHAGYYLVEAWGGKGSRGQDDEAANPGNPGYVYGVIYISYNSTIFATAGGNGATGEVSIAGGANGGGKNGTDDTRRKGGSGGGYSAFAVGATSITESTINSGNVKLIAGGSAGGAGSGGIIVAESSGDGGSGGSFSTTATTISIGTVYSGTDGLTPRRGGQGYGGSTTAGTANKGGSPGGFLYGGNAGGRGSGGGAGYYGGGGGGGYYTGLTSSTNYGPSGGGGGSSFVANGVSTTIPSGFSLGSNSSSTGGSVKITWIGYEL